MGRPKKSKPTCEHCGRVFDRLGNLNWHLSTHQVNGELPIEAGDDLPGGPIVSEPCTNCHTLEHQIEKQDTKLGEMADELSEAAAALRQPRDAEGHRGVQELLDCPTCGPPALEGFKAAGGAVLTPAEFRPQLIELVKAEFPFVSKGIEMPIEVPG